MHEVGVAQRMVEIALAAAAESGGGKIVSLRLLLGTLTCVDPATLAFAFTVAARGTPAEGARLDVEPRELLTACSCGAHGGDVVRGRELRLDTLDLEEPLSTGSTP
jgi:hydrogenase nickel incorporation protein HypA/HybF